MPRSIFGKVKTNWRCGTSWQTEAAGGRLEALGRRLEVKTEGRTSQECAPSSLRPPVSSLVKVGEAGGEVAAPEEGADGGEGIGAQRSHRAAVVLFVGGEEVVPGVVDDLPEG